jgi:hypothetical protein
MNRAAANNRVSVSFFALSLLLILFMRRGENIIKRRYVHG